MKTKRKIPLSPLLAAGAVAGQLSHFTARAAETPVFSSSLAAEVAALKTGLWLTGDTAVLPGRTVFTGGATAKPWMVDSNTVRNLYVTDGTTAGTRRLGEAAGVRVKGPLLAQGGQVWFQGWTAASGVPRLFRTDGTEAGTSAVCSLAPADSTPYTVGDGPVHTGGHVYFAGSRAAVSGVLRCDPATGQTEFIPLAQTGVNSLMTDGDDLFFLSNLRDYSTDLFRVALPGGSFTAPEPLATGVTLTGQSDGWVYFYNWELVSGGQRLTFRKTNGQTTTALADGAAFVWGSGGSVSTLAAHGRLFVSLTGSPEVTGLWVTDGTAAVRQRLLTGRVVSMIPVEGDRIAVLTERANSSTRDLWAATATGAWLVQSEVPAADPVAVPGGLALVQIQPGTDALPRTVWTSTLAAGPLRTVGTVPGLASYSNMTRTIPLDEGALLLAETPDAGAEPWVLDGVSAAPRFLRNLGPETGALASLYGEAGGKLIYRSLDLFSTSGDGTSTRLLSMNSLPAEEGNRDSFAAARAGGSLYFTAKNSSWVSAADELFRTDGSPAGTRDLDAPGAIQLSAAGTTVFMRAIGGLRYCGPSDLGAALTSLRADCYFPVPGGGVSAVYARNVEDNKLYQVREDGTIGVAGAPGTAAGDVIVYSEADGTAGLEPWRTDGTAAGTYRLVDANPGAASSFVHPAVKVGAEWWIITRDGVNPPSKLWSTNGTAAGTQLRVTLPGAAWPSEYGRVLGAAGRIFFQNAAGRIWTSDGTAAGTREVGTGTNLTVWRDRLFYTGNTPAAGNELWTSDGTADGTFMVEDLWPGPDGSNPEALTVAGDRLYYRTVLPLGTTGYFLPQIRSLSAPSAGTFAAWADAAGLTGGGAQPLSNPSGDGVPNLLKYAFNLNPGAADRRPLLPGANAGLPRVEAADVKGVAAVNITFLRRSAAGLTYTVQSSPDLVNWSPVPGAPRDTPVSGAPGWDECTLSTAVEGARRYLRVAVTQTP